jgi:hypothetical protein
MEINANGGLLVTRLFFLLFICLFLYSTSGLAREDAAVTPIAVLGEMSKVEQTMISNRFVKLLGKRYRLITQAQFARAKEQVFEELDIEQCTEDYCIQKIQEILQVERLFFLVLSKSDELTQLSITLVREEDKLVDEDICERCSIKKLLSKVEKLVKNITAEDLGEGSGRAIPVVQSTQLSLTSDPASAEVYHQQTMIGKTPIILSLPVGRAQLALKLTGYEDRLAEIDLKPYIQNRLDIRLVELKTEAVLFSFTPANALIEVNAAAINEPDRDDPGLTFESGQIEISLPLGIHRVRISHPDAMQNIEKEIFVKSGVNNFGDFTLELRPSYLEKQHRLISYQDKISTWRWKWGSLGVAGLLTGVYAYMENENASKAVSEQEEAENNIETTTYYSNAVEYSKIARGKSELAKKYNENATYAGATAVLLLGVASWIFFDDPSMEETPGQARWRIQSVGPGMASLSCRIFW